MMPRMSRPFTLLTIHAHPDDETISTGGVMARYAAEGSRVVCLTSNLGEHGEIVVPEMDTPENHARLAEIRGEELARALGRVARHDPAGGDRLVVWMSVDGQQRERS